MYTVVEDNFVAEVDGQYYATFAEAVAAANGTEVITLLANIPEAYSLTAGETLKVAKGEYTLTVSAPEGYTLKEETVNGVTTCSLERNQFTVTFVTEEGIEAPAAQKVNSGEKATRPTDPENGKHAFLGWYLGEELYDFDTAVTGDITLTAKWDTATYTATLTLKDNIDINFYVRGVQETEAALYTVKWTFNGASHEKSLAEATLGTDGRYKIVLAEVFSFQMTLPVKIEVYRGEVQVRDISYSVQQYFLGMLDNAGASAAVRAICKAGLDYGANAQIFFNGKSYAGGVYYTDVGNLANATTNPGNAISASKPGNAAARTGSISGMDRLSATLILGSETSIKVYFRIDSSVDLSRLTFSCAGKAVTAPVQESDGRYSVKILGIRSYELCRDFVLEIKAGGETVRITYSPYAYAANNWNASDADLARLCHALVAYGETARALWPNG